MTIRQLVEGVTVSGPLSDEELTTLKNNNVKTLINVRPDAEEVGQKTHPEWQQQAQELGLAYHFLPVTSGQYSLDQVQQFVAILQQAEQPTHMFCRTGTRAIHLWLLAQVELGADVIELQHLADQHNVPLADFVEKLD